MLNEDKFKVLDIKASKLLNQNVKQFSKLHKLMKENQSLSNFLQESCKINEILNVVLNFLSIQN
jgi:hypothetical protein